MTASEALWNFSPNRSKNAQGDCQSNDLFGRFEFVLEFVISNFRTGMRVVREQ
jgi:hypothetical protein